MAHGRSRRRRRRRRDRHRADRRRARHAASASCRRASLSSPRRVRRLTPGSAARRPVASECSRAAPAPQARPPAAQLDGAGRRLPTRAARPLVRSTRWPTRSRRCSTTTRVRSITPVASTGRLHRASAKAEAQAACVVVQAKARALHAEPALAAVAEQAVARRVELGREAGGAALVGVGAQHQPR